MREGALVAGFGFLLLISQIAAAPWLARRSFRQIQDRNIEIEWRLSPTNVQVIAPRSSMQADWSVFSKIVETPQGLLFYTAPQTFHWIPRSGFAMDEDFLLAVELAKNNCRNFLTSHRSLLRGFRFRVHNLLWTTFWVCVWAGALSHLITFVPVHRPLQRLSGWTLVLHVLLPLLIVVWTPSVAVGAMFNRARMGALIGLILVAILVASAIAVII
jgi:hypothetical protein